MNVSPEAVRVALYHITIPAEWNLDYWTSYCPIIRSGRKLSLTNSDNSKDKLKEKVAIELAALNQVPIFEEPQCK